MRFGPNNSRIVSNKTRDDFDDQFLSYIPKPESFMQVFGNFARDDRTPLHNLRPESVC
jgi:hypothetical protein